MSDKAKQLKATLKYLGELGLLKPGQALDAWKALWKEEDEQKG